MQVTTMESQGRAQSAPLVQVPAKIEAKNEVEFTPFGSEDRIKLSVAIIRNYVATPTREGDLPDERNCMRFLMLCRSRRLNPFEGDAFLIGFRKRDTGVVEWQLVTAAAAFGKRAELHPDFNGMESGVIVKDEDGKIIEREGDFTMPGDTLLGGWATVHFKQKGFPTKRKAKLETYRKSYGVWVNDQAGMIVKVAECQALRDSFPNTIGGMVMREEILDIDATVVAAELRRPEFARGLPAPDLTAKTRAALPAQKQAVQKPTNERPKVTEPAPDASQSPAGDTTPAEPETQQGTPVAPEVTPAPQAETSPEAEPPPTTATSEPESPIPAAEPPADGERHGWPSVKLLMQQSQVTDKQVIAWAISKQLAKPGQKVSDLADKKLVQIAKAWHLNLPAIKKFAA